jgi:uncharacterized protein (TIGR02118 family)
MHKVLLFMKRREGLSFNAFRAYYEIRHVPLCMTYMGDAKRYVRRYIERRKGEPEPEFDVITELWFEDRKLVDGLLKTLRNDAMPADVIADEEKLFDRSKTRAFVVAEAETQLPG